MFLMSLIFFFLIVFPMYLYIRVSWFIHLFTDMIFFVCLFVYLQYYNCTAAIIYVKLLIPN